MNGSITISTDPARHDLDAIHRIVAGTYWSPDIRREVVAEALPLVATKVLANLRGSLRTALGDASPIRLARHAAPHRATALGAGALVGLDAVLANGAGARCTACGAVLVVR